MTTIDAAAPVSHPDRFFIGGEWVAPSSDSMIDVIDSGTEELYFRVAEAQADDMARAVAAARTAFDDGPWPRLSHAERAEYLRAFGPALQKRAHALAQIWPRESGTTHAIAKFAATAMQKDFDAYAALAETFAFEEPATPSLGGFGLLVREPVGTVGAIVPWNSPHGLIPHKVGPALLAGCTVVLKMSPEAPGAGYLAAEAAEEIGLPGDRIVLSCKTSRLQDMVAVYRDLASRCEYPLHLGLTEAGMGSKGIVSTTAALGILLQDGIGDTIRASLTPEPGGDRTIEVRVCRELLQSLGLRAFRPEVTACPGCGRTTSTVFQELAQSIEAHLDRRMADWRRERPGVAELKVAVMGCIVNGPGESRAADIGISLPGTGEQPRAPVYVDGEKVTTLEGAGLADDFIRMVEDYVEARYPRAEAAVPAA